MGRLNTLYVVGGALCVFLVTGFVRLTSSNHATSFGLQCGSDCLRYLSRYEPYVLILILGAAKTFTSKFQGVLRIFFALIPLGYLLVGVGGVAIKILVLIHGILNFSFYHTGSHSNEHNQSLQTK